MHEVAPGPGAAGRTITAQLDRSIAALRGSALSFAGLLLTLAAIAGLFTILMPDTFARATTLQAMMFQLPELGLLSLAMAIPLISGGINLAIIATANLSSLLTAWILTAEMPPGAAGTTLALWLAGALVAGLGHELINFVAFAGAV
jgi:simple sugar transport system permease protein